MGFHPASFLLRYEGSALDCNAVPLDSLGAALAEIGAALTCLNGLLNNRDVKVSLSVKAFFEQ